MPSGQTAGELISSAMRLGNLIATGETATADELVDGLAALNDMLEFWSTQNLAVYGRASETFSTVAATANYTIGPAGTWNTTRPVRIEGDAICTYQGIDFPVTQIGPAQYDLIPLKTQQQPIVEQFLYVNDNPLGRITLFPVPSGIVSITLETDRVLTQVSLTTTQMIYPPGYFLAMRHNLAVMLCGEYGKAVPVPVGVIAASSFAAIKRANKIKRIAQFDSMLADQAPVSWQSGA
jgi:hypothetical protein